MKKYLLWLLLFIAISPAYADNGLNVTTYNSNFLGYETLSLAASSSSSSVTFTLKQSAINDSIMVSNAGSVTAFIACGVGAATASLPGAGVTGATPILPGAVIILKKNTSGNANVCAGITSTGTTTLYLTSGQGS